MIKIKKKANSVDVYYRDQVDELFATKEEIPTDFYSRSDVDGKDAAIIAMVEAETSNREAADAELNRAITAETSARGDADNALQAQIDAINEELPTKLLSVDATDVSITVDNSDPLNPKIKANLSTDEGQIVKLNADGFYAKAELDYNEELNEITFTNTNGSNTFALKTKSEIDNIYYDKPNEQIVIEYTVNGARKEDVVVPVGDLIEEWRTEDGNIGAIKLEKTREVSSEDVLSARLILNDTHDDNMATIDANALYVSKNAIVGDLLDQIAALEARVAALEGIIPSGGTFDPTKYYTKDETSGASEIAAAFNDVNTLIDNKVDVSAFTEYTASTVTEIGDKVDSSAFTEFENATEEALNNKLDASAFTEYSAYTEQQISEITSSVTVVNDELIKDELVISAALNDLNSRKLDASAFTEIESVVESALENKMDTSAFTEYTASTEEQLSEITSSITTLTDEMIDNELVVSSALNDLNSRKLDASAFTDYSTSVDGQLSEITSSITTLDEKVEEDELVISAALNDLNSRKLNASAFTEYSASTEQQISEITSSVTTVNDELIKDELVISAALNDLNDRKLDASAFTEVESTIEAELTNKLDVDEFEGYASRVEEILDEKVGYEDVITEINETTSASTNPVSVSAIMDVIIENEEISSAALNDLNAREIELRNIINQ